MVMRETFAEAAEMCAMKSAEVHPVKPAKVAGVKPRDMPACVWRGFQG
jgi:hypothetical protein